MVDESHERERAGETPRPWITRMLMGALGVTAVLHYLIGAPRARRAVPEATGPDEVRHPDGRIEHPLVRFERSDAHFSPILVILMAATIYASFHLAIVWWFFNHNERYQSAIKRSAFPLQQSPPDGLPPEPRLEQVDRMAAIEKGNVYLMEESKEHVLHTYGSTPESAYIHIPIERAMDLLANKLPARKEPAGNAQKQNGLVDSGQSNSGRMLRGEPQWFEP